MPAVVWLGDDDPSANSVTVGGRTFVKGVSVTVPKEELGKLEGNPTFSTDAKADPVEADEPSKEELAEQAEQGTVKAALKAQLRALNVNVQGNPSEDTLRKRLADELSK